MQKSNKDLPRAAGKPQGGNVLQERARGRQPLLGLDLVAQGERDALRLAADANETRNRARGGLFNAEVEQGVFAKHTGGVQVGRQEIALAHQGARWRQDLHVGDLANVVQVLGEVGDVGIDGHLVFPLELGPHGAKQRVRRDRRRDVVHNVHVNRVHDDDVALRRRGGVVHQVAKNGAALGGRHLDVGGDFLKVKRRQRVGLRPLDDLQVTVGGQLEHQVLQRLVGLVDDQNVQHRN